MAHRLIIGLDFGTTFTGIAYGVVKTNNGEEHVEEFVCEAWPRGNNQKVPSEISYSAAPGGEHQWGFDIAPKSYKLVWTKLELDQQERPDELRLILRALDRMGNLDPEVSEADEFRPDATMDPVDIVAEYLRQVREYIRDHPPADFHQSFLSTTPIDLVVTIPADWSDQAKNRTFRAVDKAGFNQQNFPRLQDTIFVAEPEAAALYTMKTQLEIEGDEFMVPGDCFVLCDAGGGTVDLVSYRVKQLVPSIELEELTIGTGAKCGATYVDRNFRTWLKDRLGPLEIEELTGSAPENAIGTHNIIEPGIQQIMHDFQDLRHQFKGLGHPVESFIVLPNRLNELHDPSRSIVNGELRITDRDLQGLFEPCVNKIRDLLKSQIRLVIGTGNRVRCVFLTGGFGQSEYLFKKVNEFTGLYGIKLKRPGPPDPRRRREQEIHCISAVMRGAVIRGLEKGNRNPIYVRKCRRHYGVSVSEPFSPFKHLERDSYIDPFDGEKKARAQVNWFLKKGDALLSSEPKHASIDICRKFGLHDPRVFRTNLLVLDDDIAPQRYADIPGNRMEAIELVYDLSGFPQNRFEIVRAGSRGQPYLCAHLKLEIRLETHLEFKVMFDNNELGNVVANYS